MSRRLRRPASEREFAVEAIAVGKRGRQSCDRGSGGALDSAAMAPSVSELTALAGMYHSVELDVDWTLV